MKPDEEQFFKAGTRDYSDALRAVCEFEVLLDAEMRAAMSRSTGKLRLLDEPGFTHGAPPPNLVIQNGNPWYYVYASLPSTPDLNNKSSRLELGVHWPGPEDSNRAVCVVAGVSTDGVYTALTKPISFRGEVVKLGRIWRLKCEVRDNDLPAAFIEVLDALASSLPNEAGLINS
jgi:hypothetical protein